ncbi:hypothetical protein JTE90_009005 [Oedothorax gibbosus]|uniref:Diuretic hormone receptor n=1 Tax=Oedothorax gibbosus TaxID=931172 RepID=A0AAV6VN34_9ARAC|nr:hypothetical protein JTE90_009005 [Oedothorax gibbosus]
MVRNRDAACPTVFDGPSCWPPTQSGTLAVIECMESFRHIQYDTTQNATRECLSNGTWALRADYSECRPLPQNDSLDVLLDVEGAFIIYVIGYGLSLIALAIAVFIFLYFRDLRCLRNTIHTNLLVTYLFIDLTWIITTSLQTSNSSQANQTGCFLVILLTYLMCTNFFWMFVEGLYLYILVVMTFNVETVKLLQYAAIGWGAPAVFIIPWAIVKHHFTVIDRSVNATKENICSWHKKDDYDYIFMGPILLVLLINIYFLGRIMWVLITKLRAATSLESKQYRKAAKALLVLIPLLGVTYIVVLYTPTNRTARIVFAYAQALLLSTQGFTVAVLYCFLNGEVRKSVRHHLLQWRDQRGIGGGRPLRGDDSTTNGGTDNYRLYPQRGIRDRTSCISLSTSTTWAGGSSCKVPQKPSNGSYSPVPLREDAC